MSFLSHAGDSDMMLLLMTVPLIRETKAKPKNNSLLDLYYPWIPDRFSLISLATSEHIKSKSCVWSAEHPLLSSLPRISKLAQRIGSSTAPEIPPLLGLATQSQEFLKGGGWHAPGVTVTPCHSSGDGTSLESIGVLPLSRENFPFSPSSFPASLLVLVLSYSQASGRGASPSQK